MPLCLASLPSWGLEWLVSPLVHQLLALLGIAIGLGTLVPGWRQHRRSRVLFLALVGLGVMNYAAFAGEECCSVPADASPGDEVPACCQTRACTENEEAIESLQPSSQFNNSFASLGSWLWAHPTAFGAALLAWAHCLNGNCTRNCCQSKSEELVALEEIS